MFSTELVVQTFISGVMIGVLYALMALGITFIYSIMRMINWAMGEFYMIGSYLQYMLVAWLLGPDLWWLAILVATAGVVAMSLKGKGAMEGGYRPVALGLFSGAMFALSAIGYRGAILSLELPHFVMAATFTLATGLVLQAILLSVWLALRDPGVLRAIAKAWKPSLFAGFMGAFASEFWFLGFAIASAANVRTLALVEVLFAQGVTRFIFKQPTSLREGVGIVLVVIGVALLVWAY
jgi:branched-subunit amino acid ABC-type transport system permease component